MLAAVALIILLVAIISPASAETVIDDVLTDYTDTSSSYIYPAGTNNDGKATINSFYIAESALCNSLGYVYFEVQRDQYGSVKGTWNNGSAIREGRHDIEYRVDGISYPGVLYYETPTNLLGQIKSDRYTLFLNEWNSTYTGPKSVNLPFYMARNAYRSSLSYTPTNATQNIRLSDPLKYCKVAVSYASGIQWKNRIVVEKDLYGYEIELFRTIEGIPYKSTIQFAKNGEDIFTSTKTGGYWIYPYLYDQIDEINVTSPSGRSFVYPLGDGGGAGPGDPDGSGITVYIKNSQTGALIANANVVIDALVDGEYYSVTNRTEPSGIFTITLQPTGGGKPNPDSYRLIVTADGYNNPMPEINFTLGDYIKYFECFLDPIAGGPADENNTFIDFFVRDMNSNPISGATVKFGKYTLITNSAGYTVFEVDKNNNYSWTVSKSGYGTLTGNAVIGNDPRHTINTVLAPIVTPTTTTPIPTSPPIGPTPTMTAPTGEPVSNWLEWFAAHFGMILGGGVEIGKIFMWLCFTVPVGVYVGKEAKAGAAGFMAGAGIVTLFFVLIGWVPIWLVVLLALIIGLLYAKAFNAQDNGGGR
jgi:hypothetical protein